MKRIRLFAVAAGLMAWATVIVVSDRGEKLSANEMKRIVGGVGFCEKNGQKITGMVCATTASFACDRVCNNCIGKSSATCNTFVCWKCAGTNQITECTTFGATSTSVCTEFAGAAKCGNYLFLICNDDAVLGCVCPAPPYIDSKTACPRKDCK